MLALLCFEWPVKLQARETCNFLKLKILISCTITPNISNVFFRWSNINPDNIPWLTKLAACAYGLVFLALAFLAEYLGGILQAALTIFGAVGGPLFGVFTLGMFTTYANQRVSLNCCKNVCNFGL